MGMLSYLMLDSKIEDLQERVAAVHEHSQVRVAGDIHDLREEAASLRQDVEDLALFTRALATLLADKGIISDVELAERVVEIEREDRVEDGQIDG